MHRRYFRSAILAALVTAVLPAAAGAEQAVAADRFVDATGVNIHLHYDDTLYRRDFALIRSRLLELGVRHVRDGLIDTAWQGYYDRLNDLGDAGITCTYITLPEQSTELWVSYPARVSRSFEAYEAPNEYDLSGDPSWAQVLADTVVRLSTVRGIPGLEQYPVYAPSLTSEAAYEALGNVSAHFDAANTHHYFAGRPPETPGWGADGYGSVAWSLELAGEYSGGKPIVTTETGYQDSPSAIHPVPPEIAGLYMPRALLAHFRAGVTRTFLYELVDFPRSGGYGLLEENGAPKPAFTAVKSLLRLLADPGPPFTPDELAYDVMGGSDDIHHMVFQKRDGTYYVALWLAVPSWDPVARQRVEPDAESVVVSFPTLMQVRTHTWQTDGSVIVDNAPLATSLVRATVTDRLAVIEARRTGLLEGLLDGLLGGLLGN